MVMKETKERKKEQKESVEKKKSTCFILIYKIQ